MRKRKISGSALIVAVMVCCALTASCKNKAKDQNQSRADYLATVQQQPAVVAPGNPGSLWSGNGALTTMVSDYKAARVNDTVTIVVVQQTVAQATGDSSAQRTLSSSSAITALPGRLKTGGINPLFGANSAQSLKGAGSASSTSKLQTSLAAQVIAVLPNGNLVVEAQRSISMNNQRETAIVRGVIRPGDIAQDNSVLSTALANLEIELKGKGLISDATRPPNVVMRIVQKILGF